MDFGNALLVSALLFGLVMWVKSAVPIVATKPILTIAVVIVAAQVALWSLRYTVWAHEQIIGGHPLDELNFGSIVAAGLFLALGSTVIDQGVKMVKNVGENQPPKDVPNVEAPPVAAQMPTGGMPVQGGDVPPPQYVATPEP